MVKPVAIEKPLKTKVPAADKRKATDKRIEPYSPAWQKRANELARDFCPSIFPCKQCNMPVIQGYCCTSCGSAEPR